MLKSNNLKDKLSKGKPVIGTWSVIPSPELIDIIASTGLDFVVIDAEHGPITFETAQRMAITCESRGVAPVMRVSSVNQSEILKALDIGMHGIHVPNISETSDIQKIVEFSKYPPLGNRGFSPFTRAGSYCGKNGNILTKKANENILTIIHIEGLDAISNIDSILATPSIDVIFVGLFDLSKSLGKPGLIDDPEVLKHLENLTKKIRGAGKFAGTISTNYQQMDSFISMGIQYITHLVDCDIIRTPFIDLREKFNKY